MSDVTRILYAIDQGDSHAVGELLPLVYDELRRLAAQKLAQEKPGQTLQATALVHEAYLRLVDTNQTRLFNGRTHFFRAAAEAMRRILIDQARQKQTRKRGGAWKEVSLENTADTGVPSDDMLAVSEALERFAQEDPVKAELVKLRFFAGFSVEEAAELLEISRASADRYWRYAKTWLYCELTRQNTSDDK
jgi:RNA polymerase sigma factor (TIGR02999 family)